MWMLKLALRTGCSRDLWTKVSSTAFRFNLGRLKVQATLQEDILDAEINENWNDYKIAARSWKSSSRPSATRSRGISMPVNGLGPSHVSSQKISKIFEPDRWHGSLHGCTAQMCSVTSMWPTSRKDKEILNQGKDSPLAVIFNVCIWLNMKLISQNYC